MSKEIDKLNEEIQKDIELDRRKKVLAQKKLDLEEKRVDISFANLVKAKEDSEKSESITFGKTPEDEIERLIKDNSDYLEAAKHPMPFINSEFDNMVPFFRKNLILILSQTGGGKSTAVCSILDALIRKKDPLTGKAYRVCVLTNEEHETDVLNRLCCHIKGWTYTNHNRFTDEQRAEFSKYIRIFTQNGNVTVIGDSYKGISGWTTTVEGIRRVFASLIKNNDIYNVVILDYYQNVTISTNQPELNQYQVQDILSNEFDRVKNIYPAALVIFAQSDKLTGPDDTRPYNIRIKGAKKIATKCTFICELIPEYELHRSTWEVHKSRFTDSIGKKIITGFKNGKYVPYTVEFQKEAAKMVERNLEKRKEQELGITESNQGEPKND